MGTYIAAYTSNFESREEERKPSGGFRWTGCEPLHKGVLYDGQELADLALMRIRLNSFGLRHTKRLPCRGLTFQSQGKLKKMEIQTVATKITDEPIEVRMQSSHLLDISTSNRELIELNLKRRVNFWQKPELFYPWWRRCTVKVLIVTDGNLC